MQPQLDPQSETWEAIRSIADEELKRLRLENDAMGNDFVRTSFLRGQIAVWKKLLALPEKLAPAHQPDEGQADLG